MKPYYNQQPQLVGPKFGAKLRYPGSRRGVQDLVSGGTSD